MDKTNKKPGVIENIAKSAVSSLNFLKRLSNTSIEIGGHETQPAGASARPDASSAVPDRNLTPGPPATEPGHIPEQKQEAQPEHSNCHDGPAASKSENTPGQNTQPECSNYNGSPKQKSAPEEEAEAPGAENSNGTQQQKSVSDNSAEQPDEYKSLMVAMLEEYTETVRGGHQPTDFENDPAVAAEREARIAANKARLAAMEQDMMAIIAANAERARIRKQEIEEELLKNEAGIARLEAERAEMIKAKTEESKARLAELMANLEKRKTAKEALALERKLLVETRMLQLKKQSEYRKIQEKSTKAIEHARARVLEHKAEAGERARAIMEERAKRIAAGSEKQKQETRQPGLRTSRTTTARSQQRSVIVNRDGGNRDARIEQIKKERELQQLRIREAAREKARLEAERRAQIEAERKARLEEIRLKARIEREKREQELKNRKDT